MQHTPFHVQGVASLVFQLEWRGEVVVELLARCALAIGWAVLAIAVTLSLNQVRF